MSLISLGRSDEEVAAMQNLRKKGKQSIQILLELRAKGLTTIQLASNFAAAFTFGLGEHRIIRTWNGNYDEVVNQHLETAFARRRIGNKGLGIDNVAAYFSISADELREYLSNPKFSSRLIPSTWKDQDGQIRSTLILSPDLLYELEPQFLASQSLPPWWSW